MGRVHTFCVKPPTIMENIIGTFYLIQPRFPNSMLIQVMLSEASARSPTLTDGGGEGL